MGIGFGIQQPLIVVQSVLDLRDVPIGTSVMYFLQTLGGAVFVCIAQNVFVNKLAEDLAKYVPNLDPRIVLQTGATSIQGTIDKQYLQGVTLAYNNGLDRAFFVATVMAVTTIIGALGVELKNIKTKKPENTEYKGIGKEKVDNNEDSNT
jgi:hypothetical protein